MVIVVTHAQCASVSALSGLSREVENLRRTVESVADVIGRIDELAALVTQVADAVNGHRSDRVSEPARPVSWLRLAADRQVAAQVLDGLCEWLPAVFLRYGNAAGRVALPECWCWHPDVVEELVWLWLWLAWLAAYEGPHASPALAGEWHERSRPGVVHRIELAVARCDLNEHVSKLVDQRAAMARPVIPPASTRESIASWWGGDRQGRAPQPVLPQLPTPLDGYR
jgi:hypothetical protein